MNTLKIKQRTTIVEFRVFDDTMVSRLPWYFIYIGRRCMCNALEFGFYSADIKG